MVLLSGCSQRRSIVDCGLDVLVTVHQYSLSNYSVSTKEINSERNKQGKKERATKRGQQRAGTRAWAHGAALPVFIGAIGCGLRSRCAVRCRITVFQQKQINRERNRERNRQRTAERRER